MLRRLLVLIATYCIVLYGEDYKILHMVGTYDLDGDDQIEFLTLEAIPPDIHLANVLRHYEMDAEGYQDLLWELNAPDGQLGHFVDLTIGDLDGDAVPELITIMNVSSSAGERLLQPILYVYPWDGFRFHEEPSMSLRLSGDQPFVRCQNMGILDSDGDGDQEVVASLGAPSRSVAVVDMRTGGDLYIKHQLQPTSFRTGSGFVHVGVVDYDRDTMDDLIVYTREANTIKALAYYNTGGEFEEGTLVQETIEGLDKLLVQKVVETDWDNDGFKDILLPFQSGHIVALTLTPETTVIDTLPVDGGPLSDLNAGDFNQDGLVDLLLVSGEMNLMTLITGTDSTEFSSEYFSLESDTEDMQVFTTLPLMKIGLYLGSVIGAGWDGEFSGMFITDLGLSPDMQVPEFLADPNVLTPEEEELLTAFPELTPDQFSLPQVPKPIRTTGQPLPSGILPRHILRVDQPFAYTIPEEEGELFYSFRWLQPPPKGMFFHYDTKSILWTPGESHLGAFQLAYHVEMRIGETVEENPVETDSLKSYEVKPELEGYDEYLWVYVNDPPVFISEPAGTEFVANSVFSYEPIIRDRNDGEFIQIDMEIYPDGMTLDTGVVHWMTDSSHVDVYDVRLVATDGFDRTAQEFKLFARAGVRIISTPDGHGSVNELYEYATEVYHQDLQRPVSVLLSEAPDGMEISDAGIITWTPESTQIDTQYVTIVAQQGVATDTQRVNIFINHPPIVTSAPPPMNLVNVGDTWDFQIEAEDPNLADKLVYTAFEMPEGMRMDPFTGRLKWDPTSHQVDFSHLRMEISDGSSTRMIEADFFVNSPIKVVSIPPLQATVGEEYVYEVMTTDRNRSSLLPFNRVVKVADAGNTRLYSVNISDDIYRENIQRYIGDWNNAETVYLTDPDIPEEEPVSRLNLKKYVHSIFYEDERLYVLVLTLDERTVKIKDVLWEFFQGSQGKPPRVVVEKRSMVRYSVVDFPEGMIVDELTGTLHWTPTKDQVNNQTITVVVSDGYTKDEQTFEVYVNHPPAIVSNPPPMGLVDEVFTYQVQVEDANEDAYLEYELIKGPQGMQMTREGKIVWVPQASQINNHMFELKVSDGYREDIQRHKVFVNIGPSIISSPKPVGLTGYEYRYRVTAEDLNKDNITLRPVRLPRYARFNPKTGNFRWKPRNNQVGPNDIIILAIDEHGATTTHSFQIHVFEDPSARQFVNTSWPLMLTFVGVMFAWSVSQM